MSMSAAVLVVEDDPLILMGTLDFVAAAGLESVGAASADQAIALGHSPGAH